MLLGYREGSVESAKERRMIRALLRHGLAATILLAAVHSSSAEDALKIAIGQHAGVFRKHNLVLDVLYTQGSAETLQSVISGSVDIGIGLGTHALLGAYGKGAPVRAIGASFTSADDQFYYVPAESPIRDMKDADGRTIATSTTGSASHMFALALGKHFGVNLKPQPTGNYASTLTQTLTRQVDIGFSQAPFNLTAVEEGKIRIIARGRDVPELRNMTSRLIVANADTLARRQDVFVRFMAGFH